MNQVKNQPATPLPFAYKDNGMLLVAHGRLVAEITRGHALLDQPGAMQDGVYLAHAANAYPKLVEDLREGHAAKAVSLLLAWVEEGAQGMPNPDTLNDAVTFARLAQRNREALLRHLGEI